MWWTMLTALLVSEAGDGPVHPAIRLDQGEVARRAAVASSDGARGDAEVAGAGARERGLDQRFYPRLGVTARYTRLSEEDPAAIDPGIPGVTVTLPGPKPDQWSFGVQLALPVSDWFLRVPDAGEAGARGTRAARWKAASARRRASLEAVLVYWNLVRVAQAEKVATQSITDATARLEETKKRVAAQVASAADVRLAEARVAETELAHAELGHARLLVTAQLVAALDLPAGAPIEIGELGDGVPPGGAVPGVETPLDELVREAWQARPEPRGLSEAEAAFSAELALTGVQRLPRLDVVANAQLANPNPRAFPQEDEFDAIWDVSAVVSWNVNGLWEAGPAEDEVRARRRALSADRQALDDGIHLELELALRAMRDAAARQRASRTMLEAAAEGHRVRTRLYAIGQATTLEVAEAETQLERARLGVVDAEIERRIGQARLAYALGRDL